MIKLLKNLNEFYQSIAEIIFALDGKRQQFKYKTSGRHYFVCVPDDILPYFSHISQLFRLLTRQ